MGVASSNDAPAPGPPLKVEERTFPSFTYFIEIAPGFWHLRVPFIMRKAIVITVDITTHMSVCRLSSGGFVVVDSVKLTPQAKEELDELTENGRRIEAVLQTHPYHTVAIQSFHALYPSSATRKWFGCPRHLKLYSADGAGNAISWAGDLSKFCVRKTFEPDLAMEIPAGAEFDDPQPPATNHFSTVFVLHRPSKTLHVDDCICYFNEQNFLMRLGGYNAHNESIGFHTSISGPGLYPTPEAPLDFHHWLAHLLDEWEFDNMVTAHVGNCYCCANSRVRQCLADASKRLTDLSAKNAERASRFNIEAPYRSVWDDDSATRHKKIEAPYRSSSFNIEVIKPEDDWAFDDPITGPACG